MDTFSEIDLFVIEAVATRTDQLSASIAKKFGISRQAAARHVGALVRRGVLSAEGQGRGRRYALRQLDSKLKTYPLEGLSEDTVWTETVRPVVDPLPDNVRGIWQYAVTELVNNAIDHSGGTSVTVFAGRNAFEAIVTIDDDGVGIFKKISDALQLTDTRQAILELAKGKFTTDPARHSGEGLFFSAKALDFLRLTANGVSFVHLREGDADTDALLPDVRTNAENPSRGTLVSMSLPNRSTTSLQAVFDRFAVPDEFTFAKTIVPVKLAQHEGDKLVSRSQAKRLTARFEKFRNVILDFEDVEQIGQGFADEVFRVFQSRYPETTLAPIRMTPAVEKMVRRVQLNAAGAEASKGDGPEGAANSDATGPA